MVTKINLRKKTNIRSKTKLLQNRYIYTLDVFIIGGPMTKLHSKKNPVILRTIQMQSNQSLSKLHDAIFKAFGRFDHHMYEFQFGKGPHDPNGARYTIPAGMTDFMGSADGAGDATRAPLGSLGLKVGRTFGYWFDFGDDWWHQINVVAIDEDAGSGKYPRVIKKVGKSPPQYIDLDDED